MQVDTLITGAEAVSGGATRPLDIAISHVPAKDSVHSDAGYSIYEGWTLKGRVRTTPVRGRPVWRDVAPVAGAEGHGRFQRRRPGA